MAVLKGIVFRSVSDCSEATVIIKTNTTKIIKHIVYYTAWRHNLAHLWHKILIFVCFKWSSVSFFLLKDVLTQAQVIQILYWHMVQKINCLESFLRGDNIISIWNQPLKLAQFAYGKCRRYLIFSVVISTSIFGIWKSASVGDKKRMISNISYSVLCQFEACAKLWRKAVIKLNLQSLSFILKYCKKHHPKTKPSTYCLVISYRSLKDVLPCYQLSPPGNKTFIFHFESFSLGILPFTVETVLPCLVAFYQWTPALYSFVIGQGQTLL